MIPWLNPTIIIVLIFGVLGQTYRVEHAKANEAKQRQLYTELSNNVKDQKELATKRYEELFLHTKTLQDSLDNSQKQIVLQDTKNVKTINSLQDKLAISLRKPNSRLCNQTNDSRSSRGGTSSSVTTSAENRTGSSAEGAGILPEHVASTLERMTLDADRINAAYSSCKALLEAERASIR